MELRTGLVFIGTLLALACSGGDPAGSHAAGTGGAAAGTGGVNAGAGGVNAGAGGVNAGAGGVNAGAGGVNAGAGGVNAGAGGVTAGTDAGSGTCVQATLLWSEDFETGDYARWTGHSYNADWKSGFCHENGFSTDHAVSPTRSHRSAVTCASDESHRGYGGLQFDGDQVLSGYTNTGTGIDAPHGVVNTFHSWLQVPYAFENGRWFSFWTTNNDCGWNDDVITLGLEDPSNRLTPAHIVSTGGTVTFSPNPPGFPLGQWVRITIYINYVSGVMAVWQDGEKLLDATFTRSDTDICHWHWGAYASQDNTDVVLYEDDNSLWKLDQALPNLDDEPWLAHDVPVCP